MVPHVPLSFLFVISGIHLHIHKKATLRNVKLASARFTFVTHRNFGNLMRLTVCLLLMHLASVVW